MAHVGCCVLLLSTALHHFVDKTSYVEVFGRFCIRTLVLKKKKGVNVGHPRHKNAVSGSEKTDPGWIRDG